jgi:hypothetical protein
MTNRKEKLRITALLLAISIVTGSIFGLSKMASADSSETDELVKNSVEIQIGEAPADLSARYGDRVIALTKNQANYGISWYRFAWPKFDGELSIKNGSSRLQLDQVGSVQGLYDSGEFPAEGISEYSINLGLINPALGPDDLISHQDARTKFYALLRRIRLAGWTRYIAANAPRLNGMETFKYQASGLDIAADMYSMDAVEMPTFDQWMALNDGAAWEFYRNGVYMNIAIYRDSKRLNSVKPGAYFLIMKLTSRDEYQRQSVSSEDRIRWKELYPQVRHKESEERSTLEAMLASKGYTIDKSYQNPDE